MAEGICYGLSVMSMPLHVITKARRSRDIDSFKLI